MKTTGNLKISNQPVLLIEPQSLAKARYMVGKHPKECQWWHRVNKQIVDGRIVYYLYDFLVPEQMTSGVEVESDPEMMMKLFKTIQTDKGISLKEVSEIIKTATCWCHSHVGMAANPSGTDNATWKEQKDLSVASENLHPQAMIIINKKGDYFTRVYDPATGIEFENLTLQQEINMDFTTEVNEIIKTRLKIKKIVTLPKVISNLQKHDGAYAWERDWSKELSGNQTSRNQKKMNTGLERVGSNFNSTDLTTLDKKVYKKITALVTKINTIVGTLPADSTRDLIRLLDSEIEINEFHILEKLVFNTANSDILNIADELHEMSLSPELYTDSVSSFLETINGYVVDPPELVAEAIQCIFRLNETTTDTEAIKVLKDWIKMKNRLFTMENLGV